MPAKPSLTDKWERILAKEGLAPVKLLTDHAGHNLKFVSLSRFDDTFWPDEDNEILLDTELRDTERATWFRMFYQAAMSLPGRYPRRKFLVECAETGYLLRAARHHRMTKQQARTVMKRFRVYMLEQPGPVK